VHDAYDSTAANLEGYALQAVLRSATDTLKFRCDDPARVHAVATGGDCALVLPQSVFLRGTQGTAQAWLQLRATNGTLVAQSLRTAVTLHGRPTYPAPLPLSGFLFAPYRAVFPGELVRIAVFAHSAGQRAGGFQIRVSYDRAVLAYSGYELPPAWRVRCHCSSPTLAVPRACGLLPSRGLRLSLARMNSTLPDTTPAPYADHQRAAADPHSSP
jgi:hypothetical protein